MKILDILNEEIYQTQQKDTKINKELPIKNNPRNNPNSSFSNVYPDKTDPFTVNKHSKDPRTHDSSIIYDAKSQDGYWDYIENISKNDELKSNPFFPRVYSIKSVLDNKGNRKMYANIEKLIDWHTLDQEEIENYYGSIINADDKPFSKRPIDYLADTLQYSASKNTYKNIKNELLVEALKFIYEMSEFYMIDLHTGNIMFRRTPHGIQLVITDPLSFKK